ncbi:uncharacterized protein LOC130692299 isoform X2 [Daphnia carinata]|uniref:uncharacterized protein LOC130692299 isoform X2 n=1 Tax=Daphnia carinata TaxID=120202 RepID=UPI00257ED15A|nr:uncharacterized protein LOC130692299 isoform X2 [Daphnia carinata]
MNWSGGYKNRYRTNSEVRKTAFQQQSRIILVDLVKQEVDNDNKQTNHIPGNEEQQYSPNLPISDSSNNVTMQQCGTPFKNIPCGTSSDSEEYGSEISNTNYSPYSSDNEIEAKDKPTTSEESSTKLHSSLIVDEDNKTSAVELAVETQEYSHAVHGSSGNSFVQCSAPSPDLTQDFPHLTQSLGFLTPVTNRRNVVCGPLDHRELKGDVSTQEKLQYSYSPSQEITDVEFQAAFISQENQINVPLTLMTNGYQEEPDANGAVVLHEHHEFLCNSYSKQPVKCSTPYRNQTFHYPTPNLSSVTPNINRENMTFPTTHGCQPIPGSNFKFQNSPFPTSVNKDRLYINRSAHFRDISVLSTPTQRENNTPNQATSSRFVPVEVIPTQRKQVRFASSIPVQKTKVLVTYKSSLIGGISEIETETLSQPPIYNSGCQLSTLLECHPSVSPSEEKEDPDTATMQGQHYQEDGPVMHLANSEQTPGKMPKTLSITSSNPLGVENENIGEKSHIIVNVTRPMCGRKRKLLRAPVWNTASSFSKTLNSRKSHYGRVHYCQCRTVVQKLKIRDAQTQTSP